MPYTVGVLSLREPIKQLFRLFFTGFNVNLSKVSIQRQTLGLVIFHFRRAFRNKFHINLNLVWRWWYLRDSKHAVFKLGPSLAWGAELVSSGWPPEWGWTPNWTDFKILLRGKLVQNGHPNVIQVQNNHTCGAVLLATTLSPAML